MSRIHALAVLLAAAICATALAQAPSETPETVSYSLVGLEFGPSPLPSSSILRTDAVQQELKLTEAQKERQEAIE